MAKPAFNKKEQQALLLLGIVGVMIILFYGGYVSGLVKKFSQLKIDVTSSQNKVAIFESSTKRETSLRRQLAHLQEVVERLQKTLPVEQDLPAVIEFLSGLASQTNVRVQSIFPQRTLIADSFEGDGKKKRGSSENQEDVEVYYKEVPIQIDALAGYHQIGTFLSMVESSEKPLRLVSLRISENPKELKRHIAQIVIQSFFKVDREK